jgi:hypothetical protein
LRRPLRSLGDQSAELIDRPSRIEEITHVPLLGKSRQFHDLDRSGLALKRTSDLLGMPLALSFWVFLLRRVVVWQD